MNTMNKQDRSHSSVLCWNIRGMNNAIAKRNLRNFIQVVNPKIICIQETKSTMMTDISIDSIWDATVHNWLFAPSQGHMGQ